MNSIPIGEPVSLAVFDDALHRIYAATDPEHFPSVALPVLLERFRSQCAGLCANALLPGDPYVALAFAASPGRATWQRFVQADFSDHPTARYATTPAPKRAVRLTDHFPSRAALEATRHYRENLRPLGLKFELVILLDTALGQRLGISVARSGVDYTDEEVDLLTRLGPHLQRAFHHAQTLAQMHAASGRTAAWREVDLTPRESEVLRWIATGRTNRDIAEILGVKAATIKTHLEHILQKLGVTNRAAAAAALRDLPLPAKG